MDDDGKVWVECWNCQDGFTYSCIDGCCVDADEGCDDCASRCDICRGKGGYRVPIDSDAARDAIQ